MASGGARKGSGRKKASHTIEAAEQRARLIQRIHDDFDKLYDAWFITAMGFYQEKTVGPGGLKKVFAIPPNPNAIRDMLDRAMGKPLQPIDGKLDTSIDLSARATAILAKLNALDEIQGRQDGDDVDGGDSEDSG